MTAAAGLGQSLFFLGVDSVTWSLSRHRQRDGSPSGVLDSCCLLNLECSLLGQRSYEHRNSCVMWSVVFLFLFLFLTFPFSYFDLSNS